MSTPADGKARASQPGSVPSVQETSYLSRPEGRIGYDVAGGRFPGGAGARDG